MNRKKPDITQEICDQVKFLIKGGATNRKAGSFVGLSATTVSRIRTADYNAERYRKNNEIRNAEEKKAGSYACGFTGECELPEPGIMLTDEGPVIRKEMQAEGNQVPGQMAMDLPQTLPPSDLPPEAIEKLQELMKETILTAQVKAIMEKLDDNELKTNKAIYACADRIGAKLDKLNDNLCQILRRMDK